MNLATVDGYQAAKARLINAMEGTRPPYGREWSKWWDRRQAALLKLWERHQDAWSAMHHDSLYPEPERLAA